METKTTTTTTRRRRSSSRSRTLSLKQCLGFKGVSCCWATISVGNDERDEGLPPQEEEEEEQQHLIEVLINPGQQPPPARVLDPGCFPSTPATSGMNLATALAAERQFRDAAARTRARPSTRTRTRTRTTRGGAIINGTLTARATPLRMSLMKLLEEMDGVDARKMEGTVSDRLCCERMRRKKGTAFIPCGHVCSREPWLNRGSCRLCNRSILNILHIF